ncbi:hypothetical protein J4P41_07170 [Gluconobacter sp. NFX36]|uniref:hypothetical protein n=1 Tax=Gluconobacter sp. NFX36 TaxID=2819535 RepID=UPI003CF6117A
MSHDSTPASEGAKTIFNTVEIDFRDAIKALSREDLEKIAGDQCTKLCLIWESVIEMLSINNPPSRDKMLQIAGDMLEALDDEDVSHEVFYGGEHRERLLKLFPALRSEGDAA